MQDPFRKNIREVRYSKDPISSGLGIAGIITPAILLILGWLLLGNAALLDNQTMTIVGIGVGIWLLMRR